MLTSERKQEFVHLDCPPEKSIQIEGEIWIYCWRRIYPQINQLLISRPQRPRLSVVHRAMRYKAALWSLYVGIGIDEWVVAVCLLWRGQAYCCMVWAGWGGGQVV